MDIVITYVNGQDPLWQKDFADFVGGKAITKRYRDWGTLRYLFRGIEKHIKGVEKVHLVVARDSQVPEWINRDKVHVVLHKDIFPDGTLPCFNSSAIEMFLHRIPGLAEEFIYFNDDCFPMKDCCRDDFFRDGKVIMKHNRCITAFGAFRRLVQDSDRLARRTAGLHKSPFYMRPQHICTPMLRSVIEKVYDLNEEEIARSITPLRRRGNYNQYLFTDYMYYTGLTIQRSIPKKHFSTAVASAARICEEIVHPTKTMICINDVEMQQEKFEDMSSDIISAFQAHFPAKSQYEK